MSCNYLTGEMYCVTSIFTKKYLIQDLKWSKLSFLHGQEDATKVCSTKCTRRVSLSGWFGNDIGCWASSDVYCYTSFFTDADERTPRTPPPRRSPRSKKSARTSENSESDADEQTPTSPRPPRRAPRGKKKACTTSNSSDHGESDPADGPRKKKKTNNKGQHAKTPGAAGQKKFANYSEDEDYLIPMAFVNVTVDPIRGVGQKSETFWTRVHEKFCLLQQKEMAVIGFDIIVRTGALIEQRWKKRISRSVQLWNKHYTQLKGMQKSGWNEDKYIKRPVHCTSLILVRIFESQSVYLYCISCRSLIQWCCLPQKHPLHNPQIWIRCIVRALTTMTKNSSLKVHTRRRWHSWIIVHRRKEATWNGQWE